MKFQAGQKVRFVADCTTLDKGREYTVRKRHSSDEGVEIVGHSGWWYDMRFEAVEIPAVVQVRTKDQVLADRRKELLDGVVANHSAGIEVPREWIEELYYSVR